MKVFDTAVDPSETHTALDEARQAAHEVAESGERCVRNHTASAVATALAGGLLLGFAIGWGTADSQHQNGFGHWKRRLHL